MYINATNSCWIYRKSNGAVGTWSNADDNFLMVSVFLIVLFWQTQFRFSIDSDTKKKQ